MIIAIDFDGTCVTHSYPEVGKDIGAVPILKKLVENGHQLILWTMRDDDLDILEDNHLSQAVNWFKENNIELYGIQENPTQNEWTLSRKCYAQLYIDDAALGCPLTSNKDLSKRPFVDWKLVELMLIKNGLIKQEAPKNLPEDFNLGRFAGNPRA